MHLAGRGGGACCSFASVFSLRSWSLSSGASPRFSSALFCFPSIAALCRCLHRLGALQPAVPWLGCGCCCRCRGLLLACLRLLLAVVAVVVLSLLLLLLLVAFALPPPWFVVGLPASAAGCCCCRRPFSVALAASRCSCASVFSSLRSWSLSCGASPRFSSALFVFLRLPPCAGAYIDLELYNQRSPASAAGCCCCYRPFSVALAALVVLALAVVVACRRRFFFFTSLPRALSLSLSVFVSVPVSAVRSLRRLPCPAHATSIIVSCASTAQTCGRQMESGFTARPIPVVHTWWSAAVF